MRLHNAIAATALMTCSVLAYGCSATVTTTTPPPPADNTTAPSGCTPNDTLNCSGGGDGWSCGTGDNPENDNLGLSCSVSEPDPDGVHDDFCCIDFSGSTSSCVPIDSTVSGLTCSFGSYQYQCDANDDPTSLDSTLVCSSPVQDPDGVHSDFCCQ